MKGGELGMGRIGGAGDWFGEGTGAGLMRLGLRRWGIGDWFGGEIVPLLVW